MDVRSADEHMFHGWVARGDLRRAGAWLVYRFSDEVFGLCAAMVRDRSAAEDLAQDVFGQAFASLGRLRGEASARTWILTIARNHCIDHLRALDRDPWRGADPDGEPDAQPVDAPLPADLLADRAAVEDALAALAEGERALVMLRFRHGLEYAELAAALGLREGAVRVSLSRALAKMRQQLLATAAPAASTTRARTPPSAAAPRGASSAEQSPASPAPSARRASGPLPTAGALAQSAILHPLAAFLRAEVPSVSAGLRARLLGQAQLLGAP
jgi:RNA polymerase sigma-70 factor (ECF subfamily)